MTPPRPHHRRHHGRRRPATAASAAAMLALVVGGATIGSATVVAGPPTTIPASPTGTPAGDGSPADDRVLRLDPAAGGGNLPPVDGAPAAPRLNPDPADYTTPAAAAAAYFAAWCHRPPGAPAAARVEQAIGWLTLDGWRDDQARAAADPPPAPGVGVDCGPIRADPVTAAPGTGTVVWVRIRARQVWVRDGAVLGDHQVGQVRRVVRGGDGRWLVDVQVWAG